MGAAPGMLVLVMLLLLLMRHAGNPGGCLTKGQHEDERLHLVQHARGGQRQLGVGQQACMYGGGGSPSLSPPLRAARQVIIGPVVRQHGEPSWSMG